MEISRRTLSIVAGGLGFFALAGVATGLVESKRPGPGPAETTIATEPDTLAAKTDPATVDDEVFTNVQNDQEGFDHHPWNAPVDAIARRGQGVRPGFGVEDPAAGEPGLPTILWVGMGLPPNHQLAQAWTFDAAAVKGMSFSTEAHGRTEYIFVNGQFGLAVQETGANDLDRVRDRLAATNQEITALHLEETFAMEAPGSGLPPEAIRSDCYKREGTNTRIYVIEKWSTSVIGTVKNHHAWVVYVPNTEYHALMAAARSSTRHG